MFVKVQNGYELDELHNVSAQSPANGQTIVYNSSTSLWEKNTVSLTAGVNGTLPIANGGSGYTAAPTVTIVASNQGSVGSVVLPTGVAAVLSSNTGVKIKNTAQYLSDFRDFQSSVYGMFAAKYPGTLGNGLQVILVDNAVYTWASANTSNATAKLILNSFPGAPGTSNQASVKGIMNDELHVLVLDSVRGTWSGVASQVLEKYSYLSKIKGVTRSDGTNLYFRDALNSGSKYVWVLNTPSAVQINDPQNADWNQQIDSIAANTNLRDLKSAAVALTLSGGADDFAAKLKKRNYYGFYSYATPQGQKEAANYASGLKSKLLKINVIEFIQRNKTALGLGLLLLGGGLWYYFKIKKK